MTPRVFRGLRAVLLALAVALPLAPIVAGVLIGSGAGAPAASASSLYRPLTQQHTAQPPRAPSLVPPGQGALVALLRRPVALRAAPAGRELARLGLRTEFGSPQALLVVRRSGAWLGVVSSAAGNNRIGWVPAGAATLGRVSYALTVSLTGRRLTVLRAGRPVKSYPVAIGRPSAPTPTGRFDVTDLLSTGDPTGPYGCCILALSARSPHAIQGWNGGDRIAIHSTPETASIGQPVSHGCVRVSLAAGRWLLANIPLGTPVRIT